MGETIVAIELNRVDKREIEALAIVPFIRAVAKKIGLDAACAILCEVNRKEAFDRGRSLAQTLGRNDIDALVEEVQTWGRGGGWEMRVLERTPRTYFFDVTRCPYAERYEALRVRQFGGCLSCCRDEPFARGFNSRLRLERTKTLMEGAECCDFRYHLQEK